VQGETAMKFKLHDRVKILSSNSDDVFGVVNGYGLIFNDDGSDHKVVLVKLDTGFYDEAKVHWTSTVVVHEENLATVAIN